MHGGIEVCSELCGIDRSSSRDLTQHRGSLIAKLSLADGADFHDVTVAVDHVPGLEFCD
jgi:hypothetical protein